MVAQTWLCCWRSFLCLNWNHMYCIFQTISPFSQKMSQEGDVYQLILIIIIILNIWNTKLPTNFAVRGLADKVVFLSTFPRKPHGSGSHLSEYSIYIILNILSDILSIDMDHMSIVICIVVYFLSSSNLKTEKISAYCLENTVFY